MIFGKAGGHRALWLGDFRFGCSRRQSLFGGPPIQAWEWRTPGRPPAPGDPSRSASRCLSRFECSLEVVTAFSRQKGRKFFLHLVGRIGIMMDCAALVRAYSLLESDKRVDSP